MKPKPNFFGREPKRPKGGKLGKTVVKSASPQEPRAQKKLRWAKARLTPGSGSKGHKGDIDIPQPETIRAECKTTSTRTLEVETSWIRKIDREAREVRKTPALIMGFETIGAPCPKDWIAIPLEKLQALIEAAGWSLERVDV